MNLDIVLSSLVNPLPETEPSENSEILAILHSIVESLESDYNINLGPFTDAEVQILLPHCIEDILNSLESDIAPSLDDLIFKLSFESSLDIFKVYFR